MKRLLYITPYFPPQTRVGALRPLKFVRHLRQHGWEPIVLCDLSASDRVDWRLPAALPEGLTVLWDYSSRSRAAHAKLSARKSERAEPAAPETKRGGPRWYDRLPSWLNEPELVPLGEHAFDMPHALKRSREALRQHGCEAIVVNIDPHAAALVGARLAEETGVPLLLDLRDPWALCELRRPRRPAPIRKLVDALERYAVTRASAIVLNTETACRDYRQHYADLDPERFLTIRNSSDPTLFARDKQVSFDRKTLLFLGDLRRFVEGDILLELLAELGRRGLKAADLQLVVTGSCPDATLEYAQKLGVEDMLQVSPRVSYLDASATLEAADVLVVLGNRTRQRIPAKFYDSAKSSRPLLVIGECEELSELLRQRDGSRTFGFGEISAMADYVADLLKDGRPPAVKTGSDSWSAEIATARLAHTLDRVTGGGDSVVTNRQ
jgi:hypothetical protein